MGGLTWPIASSAAGTVQRPSPAMSPEAATGMKASASWGFLRCQSSLITDPMHMSTCMPFARVFQKLAIMSLTPSCALLFMPPASDVRNMADTSDVVSTAAAAALFTCPFRSGCNYARRSWPGQALTVTRAMHLWHVVVVCREMRQ